MEHPENDAQYKGLRVETSPMSPGSVNPYVNFRARRQRTEFSVDQYVEGILRGDVTMLSRAVTLLESTRPEHEHLAQQVIARCLPHAGNSVRIGISGVPGAGKSTSIDEFGLHVLGRTGGKLAVLAIDPTSERTGGSILGDKTRMEKLSVHPDSFIRPSPSGGSLGGVARKTRLQYYFCGDSGRWAERDGLSFHGGLFPCASGGRHWRRTAGYQAWYYGNGRWHCAEQV